jgi:hypothetical protein
VAKNSGSGFILPLILFGASLFGFGIYQANKPERVEVNKGFETTVPKLPGELEASVQDAAQRAAELDTQAPEPVGAASDSVKEKNDGDADASGTLELLSDYPWLSSLASSQGAAFREKTIAALVDQTRSGNLACRPNLTKLDAAGVSTLEDVRCLAKAGEEVRVEFDQDGGGNLELEREDGRQIRLSRTSDGLSLKVQGN